MIVIDEFAELRTELPEFIDGLVRIARVGRSLGVNLVLATQRPSGVVTPEMQSNINLRVALRVTDRADSSDILGSGRGGAHQPATAGPLDFIECDGVRRRVECWRRRHSELPARFDHERFHVAPVRTQRQGDLADRILPPLSRPALRDVLDSDARLRVLRSVVAPFGEDCGRGTAADLAAGVFAVRRDALQILGQRRVKRSGLRRKQDHQRVASRLRDGGVDRCSWRRGLEAGVAVPFPNDGIDGIEDGDVDDGDGPARTPRSELFAEHAILAGRNRRVVDAGGVNRDPVPMDETREWVNGAGLSLSARSASAVAVGAAAAGDASAARRCSSIPRSRRTRRSRSARTQALRDLRHNHQHQHRAATGEERDHIVSSRSALGTHPLRRASSAEPDIAMTDSFGIAASHEQDRRHLGD